MAVSLVQEGSGFPYIAPPVYKYLHVCSAELSTIEPTVDDVPNLEVTSFIKKVQNIADCKRKWCFRPLPFSFLDHQVNMASDDLSLKTVCLNELTAILEARYILPVTSIGMEGKPELIRTLLLHHSLLRSKAELDQLKSGLAALGVLDAMSQYPTILEPSFVAGKQTPLTAANAFFSARAMQFSTCYADHITILLITTIQTRCEIS